MTITTHREIPCVACTLPEAYKDPIIIIHAPINNPPATLEVLRPQRSAKRKAGIVTSIMRSAETPDARNDAVLEVNPADWKSKGAYCYCQFCPPTKGSNLHITLHQSHSIAAFPLRKRQERSASTHLFQILQGDPSSSPALANHYLYSPQSSPVPQQQHPVSPSILMPPHVCRMHSTTVGFEGEI